jgi:hypothetical protein
MSAPNLPELGRAHEREDHADQCRNYRDHRKGLGPALLHGQRKINPAISRAATEQIAESNDGLAKEYNEQGNIGELSLNPNTGPGHKPRSLFFCRIICLGRYRSCKLNDPPNIVWQGLNIGFDPPSLTEIGQREKKTRQCAVPGSQTLRVHLYRSCRSRRTQQLVDLRQGRQSIPCHGSDLMRVISLLRKMAIMSARLTLRG